MDNNCFEDNMTLRAQYDVLVKMCAVLENDPDNDNAISAFVDAAYNIAKANCAHLFPEDMLCVNAAKTPAEGRVVTAVKEED